MSVYILFQKDNTISSWARAGYLKSTRQLSRWANGCGQDFSQLRDEQLATHLGNYHIHMGRCFLFRYCGNPGLRDLGYVEGQTIVIEYRWAEGEYDRFPDLVADLIRLKVDVIVTAGTPGTLAAKQATKTIPIVMAVTGDAVGAGLVVSLAQPGGNVTGLTTIIPDLE